MKQLKKIIAMILVIVFILNDFPTIYAFKNTNKSKDSKKNQSCEYVLQAKDISLKCKNKKITGMSLETEVLPFIDDGIISMLTDDTKIISGKNNQGDVVENKNSIYSTSSYCVNASSIIANTCIVAEKHINYKANSIKSNDKTILYSKNGDININSNRVDFNGIIYAPNGTVKIDSKNITVNGVIIAEKIFIKGKNVVINKTSDVMSMVDELEFIRTDKIFDISTFYDVQLNKIVFMWDRENDDFSASIYARYDNGSFKKIANTKESIYYANVNNFSKTADFMIVNKNYYGVKTNSKIFSYTKNKKEICQEVLDDDKDGIPNAYEIIIGTNPKHNDTDKDGFNDGYEILTQYTDPLVHDDDTDFDEDGLSNLHEMTFGTNPFLKDSDFDGLHDEVDQFPLNTRSGVELLVNEEIPVHVGYFDNVQRYVNENGEKCENVYNWLTDSVKKQSIGNKKVYGVFNAESKCTAMITQTPNTSIVNTYSYSGDLLDTIAHNGFIYDFSYDDENNLIGINIGENNILQTTYNENKLETENSVSDSEIEYIYNEKDKLKDIEINGEIAYSITYDSKGNVSMYDDMLTNTSYEYKYETVDDEEVLKSVTSNNGFSIEYNSEDNIYAVAYTDEELTKSQYSVIENDAENATNTITTNLITGDGKLMSIKKAHESIEQVIYVNNSAIVSTQMKYSENGIDGIVYQDGKRLEYNYNQDVNIASIFENKILRVSYEYDDMNQLVRENNAIADKTIIYSYDNYGNILEVTEYPFTTGAVGTSANNIVYSYNDNTWNDLLTEYNGERITYDKTGNPINYRNDMVLSWDAKRQLASVLKDTNKIEYTYDINGIRTSKIVNGVKTFYNIEDSKIINAQTGSDVIWFIYDESDAIIGMEYNGNAYYFEKNSQKDIERIFSSDGELVCTYYYDAYGNIVRITGDKYIARMNPFRYRSYYFDEETGFYYLQTRYYDPITRRFINADSASYLGMSGSSYSYNLFAYCENNPIMYDDPNGNIFKFNQYFTVSGTFEKNPSYNPTAWNGRKSLANCYAYALNIYANANYFSSYKLQPGELSGKYFMNYSGNSVAVKIISAMNADLKKASADLGYNSSKYLKSWDWRYAGPINGTGYDIALVLDLTGGFRDYHWYRKDSNGYWSHKPGVTAVTNLDASGNKITNPQNANRKYASVNYSTYVTSFRIYRNGVY